MHIDLQSILDITGFAAGPYFCEFADFGDHICLFSSATIVNGGDQLTAVITFLLIPICLSDDRKNHWANPGNAIPKSLWKRILLTNSFIAHQIIRLQIAFVYFNGFTSKLGGRMA